MKTVILTYAIMEGLLLVALLIMIVATEPTFDKNGRNKMACNWGEGGKYLFRVSFWIAAVISFFVLLIILFGKIIDKL